MRTLLIGKDGAVQHFHDHDRHEREDIIIPAVKVSPGSVHDRTITNEPRRFGYVGTTPNRVRIYEER